MLITLPLKSMFCLRTCVVFVVEVCGCLAVQSLYPDLLRYTL